jgi:phenylacetate-coenzyme A ligase PaaK-like adenylate-forming protein
MLAAFRRYVIDPVYAVYTGGVKRSYWKTLEKTQYLPQEKLEAIQRQRVKEMIQWVYKHNSFYRQRFEEGGFHPDHLVNEWDIKKIPLTYKHQILENATRMISEGYDINKLMEFKTGGSTGKPLKIYISEECSEQRNALARRHDRWSGWEVGDAVGAAWGNPPVDVTWKEKLKRKLLEPYIFFDTMQVTDDLTRQFAQKWKKIKPTLLFGHAHSIFILAENVKRLGITSICPKGIISSSMMLLPHERKVIEEVFQTKVTDRYGCEEVSLIASECEQHKGMHLNIEHLYIEFLKQDGSDAIPGELGTIVVTDLMNKAMPFIRYKVEDNGIPADRQCSCGRGLPLMEAVVGRTADFLIKPDGTRVAGISLIENTLTKITGIAQMQIIQEKRERLILNIVPTSGFDQQKQEQVKSYFNDLFGFKDGVILNIVEEIKPESSGKYRFSICRLST